MYDARTKLAEQVAERGADALRGQGLPERHPPDGADLGGPVVRAADHGVRPELSQARSPTGSWPRRSAVARRSGLGKGLGALIPTEVARESGSTLREVPISSIRPNPLQPRTHFDEEALVVAGRLHPGGRGPPARPGARDGHRRLRADRGGAPVAGGTAGRAPDDARAGPVGGQRRPQPRAGAGREPPPRGPQRAGGGGRLPAADRRVRLHPRAGGRPGRPSRSAVTNTLRLLQLPAGVQRALADGTISAGHARALLGTPDRAFQEELAKTIVAEGLNVRAVEDIVRQRTQASAREGGEAGGARDRRATDPVTPAGRRPPSERRPVDCRRRACSSSRSCCPITSTHG